jgi:formate dehydrogenase subunit beta
MQEVIKAKAVELLQSGQVSRVLGWTTGEFFYDVTPAVFTTPEEIERDFIYTPFCGANLSKYLIAESRKEGKVAAFLKPCDTYSFNQLIKEHRIKRENVYIVGIQCDGMCDIEKIKAAGVRGILNVHESGDDLVIETLYGEKTVARSDALLERCACCKSKKLVAYDEIIGVQGEENPDSGRFDMVAKLEAMTPDERFAFWQGELSRCIRCNACRNVCPACSCEKCVFDNPDSGIANKAAADSFEEQNFHIIRAFHVASRCTDCGECSRVCPQHIPLHLLNRKFIKDINELYGFYQSGADLETDPPLMHFTKDDCEPSVVYERGGDHA